MTRFYRRTASGAWEPVDVDPTPDEAPDTFRPIEGSRRDPWADDPDRTTRRETYL